jgi:hypothetical protein
MSAVIGPVLKRGDGYVFDTWMPGRGLSRGYPYRRIEDAIYARNATIWRLGRDRTLNATVCQTLDEFVAASTGYTERTAA